MSDVVDCEHRKIHVDDRVTHEYDVAWGTVTSVLEMDGLANVWAMWDHEPDTERVYATHRRPLADGPFVCVELRVR